jgi:D-sedoheptulose 7-phosphate isomerase
MINKMKNQDNFFNELKYSIDQLNQKNLENLVKGIKKIKENKGRIFFLGVGGSAGNSSHAVNDFRKICNIECYSPADNVSELTARTNDEGFDKIFSKYLINSRLSNRDAIFIMSVGGGNKKLNISTNLIEAILLAKKKKAKVFSIVGRKDGYAYKHSNISMLIKVKDGKLLTPISESMQAVIWHFLVTDKRLQSNKTKW